MMMQPVTMQPQGMMMMQPMVQQYSMPMIMTAPAPSQIPVGTAPGLEFLLPTHQIMIQQQIEWGEVLVGMHMNNKYHILDAWGRRMYFAGENNDCCTLSCCGSARAWDINIYNCMGQHVMQGSRDCSCCCNNTCQVVAAGGVPLGGVVENCEAYAASWNITNGVGAPILLLKAPDCSVCCPGCTTCYQADFPIFTIQGNQQIGRITKYYGGYMKEAMTAADSFGVEFPADLDVSLKAVLIYATFLIDFKYYESVPTQDHHHHHGGYHHHHHW